jgi:Phosphate-selective porin O and P
MKMKKISLSILSLGMLVFLASSQSLKAQSSADTLAPHVTTLRDRVSGVEDRLATAEADLSKLTKIKISGYVQAQWQNFEQASVYPSNYFQIRRARFKLVYEPATGVAFVVQPDFQPSNFVIKEAYARLNIPGSKTFSLWAGKFNRPNYEVEYSSSDLENLERSKVITSIYPGEYAIGAKLEVTPPQIPLKFQLAVFNGNDNMTITDATGANINPDNKDFDNSKDIMARLTYAFKLGSFGGLTIGAHTYIGSLRATVDTVLKSDYTFDKTVKVGKSLSRNWVGFEAQLYMDILGGMTLKGEYIMGTNAYPGFSSTTTVNNPTTFAFNKTNDTLTMSTLSTKTTSFRPNIIRNFSGYYVYLIKNIGKRHQISIRYDYYDPNTKIAGSDIANTAVYGKNLTTTSTKTITTGGSPVIIDKTTTTTVMNSQYKSGTADVAYGTLGFCYNYYITDNIKIAVAYDIPMNEKVGVDPKTNLGYINSAYSVPGGVGGTNDYSKLIKANMLTIRLQAKF